MWRTHSACKPAANIIFAVMTFEIPLAEQKIKPHQVTALHLMAGFALVAAGAFIIFVFTGMMLMPFRWDEIAKDSSLNMHKVLLPEYLMIAAGLIILFLSFFKNKWLLRPRNNKTIRIFELVFCAAIAGYSLYTNAMVLAGMFGILSVAIVYSFFAENAGARPVTVVIDEKGIRLPMSVRRRHINWAETEKVLLRHGTLTISCLDSKLYQWITTPNDTDSTILEAFCHAHIEAAQKDRKNYDW